MRPTERRQWWRDSSCRRNPGASPRNRSTRRSISRTRKTPLNTCLICLCANATTATTRRCSPPPPGNLISPEAIQRIDFLDGPFSAAYPGNSIGGVLLITSKMPDKPFAVAKETVSVMPWDQYGTKDTYVTSQTSAAAGNRNGALSWLVTANYLDSYQQPLTYTTTTAPPANTTGTIIGLSKQGTPQDDA